MCSFLCLDIWDLYGARCPWTNPRRCLATWEEYGCSRLLHVWKLLHGIKYMKTSPLFSYRCSCVDKYGVYEAIVLPRFKSFLIWLGEYAISVHVFSLSSVNFLGHWYIRFGNYSIIFHGSLCWALEVESMDSLLIHLLGSSY